MAANFGLVGPAQFMIRPRRRQLDRAEAMHQSAMHRPAGEGKILDRPQRMDAPENVGGNVARAQEIGF